jgi:hypothetical protein
MFRGAGRLQLINVALAALVVAWLTLPRLELCVGVDGHVALEPLGAACCEETQVDVLLGADSHCANGCVDTPLEVSAASASLERQHVTPPVLTPVGGQRGLRPPISRRIARRGSVPLPALPRALRTTVLLC